jgi:hypothetical protein
MFIIADRSIPEEALASLSGHGEVLPFSTHGITYPAISGHPDIFFCPVPGDLVVAPGLGSGIMHKLEEHHIRYVMGKKTPGSRYPASASYNAVVTERHLIHNLESTDEVILDRTGTLKPIHVRQGYTRCNLLPLKNEQYITSDKGIYQTMLQHRLEVLYVDPGEIILEGFPHGFFGGCCGISGDNVFITGSLEYLEGGQEVSACLKRLGYRVVELYDGPLVDGGSLIFL